VRRAAGVDQVLNRVGSPADIPRVVMRVAVFDVVVADLDQVSDGLANGCRVRRPRPGPELEAASQLWVVIQQFEQLGEEVVLGQETSQDSSGVVPSGGPPAGPASIRRATPSFTAVRPAATQCLQNAPSRP